MATLKKIGILGIRSFGDDKVELVHFQKPLTVILGENGCGKSTIIECLRFITTQEDLSKKKTFIHDPLVANKPEVKAVIKLNMTDKRGQKMDLTRTIQASRSKKNVLQSSSIDNTLTKFDEKGKAISISQRCADFGAELSRAFGVSKAILEHVIFCTQEDSHWPLETDKKLKETFDEIFDSKKYNNCVNKIRDQKKKFAGDLKISDANLNHLKYYKKDAESKKNELKRLKQQIDDCNSKMESLQQSLQPIENKLKEINEKEMNIALIQSKRETKKTQLKEMEKYEIELCGRIEKEFDGTDEELKRRIDNFSRQLKRSEQEINELESKCENAESEVNQITHKIQNVASNLAVLEIEEKQHQKQIKERNSEVSKIGIDLDISKILDSQPSQISEDTIQSMLVQINKKIIEKEKELEKHKQEMEKMEDKLQSNIDKLRNDLTLLEGDLRAKEKEYDSNEREVNEVRAKINEVDQSASKLARLEMKLSETSKMLENVQRSFKVEDKKSEIQKFSDELKNFEQIQRDIDYEVKKLQEIASIKTELDLFTNQKNNKQADMKKFLNKHGPSMESLLGSVPSTGFAMALNSHMDTLTRQIRESNIMKTKKEKELTEFETNHKMTRMELRKKEEELRTAEENIYEECLNSDLDHATETLAKDLQDIQNEKGLLTSAQKIYEKYIQTLRNTNPCCPLCHRNFEREHDAQNLIDELKSKIREVPSDLTNNQSRLESKQKKYKKLLALKPVHERGTVLKTIEIPQLKATLETLSTSMTKTRNDIDELNNNLLPLQTDQNMCQQVQADAGLMDQINIDLRKLDLDIEKLNSQMPPGSNNRTLKDALKEQDEVKVQVRNTRQKVESLKDELNIHNEQVQKLQTEKNNLMETKAKVEGGVGQRKQLEDRYSELQILKENNLEEVDSLRAKLGPAKRNLNDAIAQRNEIKNNNKDRIQKKEKEFLAISRKVEDIRKLQNAIRMTEAKDITGKLETKLKEKQELECEKEQKQRQKKDLLEKINGVKKDVNMQKVRERELEDNLKLREKRVEKKQALEEIKDLDSKFGSLNFDDLRREKKKLKAEEDKISNERARTVGRKGELENRVETTKSELGKTELLKADENFKEELIKNELFKVMEKDLSIYAMAMEWAMVTYHKEQMAKVNSFIREYWRQIYQGNDIDFIEIKTDETEQTGKKRSYNYRVVQVKETVELEMKGRCSAGQKMLASLIIRIALAETFSSNCGIITLDEPTTNLDRKNVKQLAQTLNELIVAKLRNQHSNFQLIVITHDEMFIKDLMKEEAIDEYVRVFRNDRGKSKVETVPANGMDLVRATPDEEYLA